MRKHLKRFLAPLAKKTILAAKAGGFLERVLTETKVFTPTHKIGEFSNLNNEVFPLYSGYRDFVVPGWRGMTKPDSGELHIPDSITASKAIALAENSTAQTLRFLDIMGFSISGKNVLEIGCYDGTRSFSLAAAGAGKVLGSDVTAYYVRQTISQAEENMTVSATQDKHYRNGLDRIRDYYKATIPHRSGAVAFADDDISETSLFPESYDCIFSFEVLEHVQNPEKVFRNIGKLLKPGGFAFHEYNPFFAMNGGHSLCTLDFPWGHASLSPAGFKAYLQQFRPAEINVAWQFYTHNLNRMAVADMHTFSAQAGLKTLSCIFWPEHAHMQALSNETLCTVNKIYPNVTINDLISPTVWVLHVKPT
jgi:2-polyprenyl-3-methyl-5-hydroxy-6-metoxy-1,4-benzoquinol methylase